MIRCLFAALVCNLALNAQTPPPLPSPLPPPLPSPEAGAFELPGPVPAADQVPAALLTGPTHEVQELAYADGLHLSFRLLTEQGMETVLGTPSLALRIREVRAVAKLREMNKSEEFAKALVQAGKDKVESVKGVVKDPVGTLKKLPQGASRFFGRLSNAVQRAGEGESDGRGMLESALGVRQKKAQLALDLGVSPYSTDIALQHELDLAARAMAGGALVVNVAGMAVDGGAGAALSMIGINQTLQRALVESTPEELQAKDHATLTALRVPEAEIATFFRNPWFSPWQSSLLVHLLQEIGVDPSLLLRQAASSMTQHDARYFVQLARLYHHHDQNVSPLSAFREEFGLLCALDSKGSLVVAVAADLIQWSPLLQSRAEEFQTLVKADGPVRSLVLITDGALSPRASEELFQRHVPSFSRVLGPVH